MAAVFAPITNAAEELAAIKAAQDGNVSAQQQLITFVLPHIEQFCQQYVSASVELCDLIHEAILGIPEAINRFDFTKGLRFWTYARSWVFKTIQLYLKSIYYHFDGELPLSFDGNDDTVPVIPAAEQSPEFQVLSKDQRRLIRKVLHQLQISRTDRKIIVLRLMGWSFPQIGAYVDMPRTTVNTHFNQCIEAVRNTLAYYLGVDVTLLPEIAIPTQPLWPLPEPKSESPPITAPLSPLPAEVLLRLHALIDPLLVLSTEQTTKKQITEENPTPGWPQLLPLFTLLNRVLEEAHNPVLKPRLAPQGSRVPIDALKPQNQALFQRSPPLLEPRWSLDGPSLMGGVRRPLNGRINAHWAYRCLLRGIRHVVFSLSTSHVCRSLSSGQLCPSTNAQTVTVINA